MKKLLAGLAAMATIAAPACAVDVKSIKITNAIGSWIQVSEVVATQYGTGDDVALASAGATATASSVYSGIALPDYAIDGIFPASYPTIFHSGGTGSGEWLLVTFAQTFDISSLSIYGRVDCCAERDQFNYTLYDTAGSTVGSGFLSAGNDDHVGTATFAAGGVPEPASWAMMLGGFGLMGAAMRRRRAKISFA